MILDDFLKDIKKGNESRFYKSRLWRNKRNEIMRRDNNECQSCKEKGKMKPADVVHHIKHLKDHPYLALENDNLISLCHRCHYHKHSKNRNPEKYLVYKKKEPITPERW